jgi:hypothetical protein
MADLRRRNLVQVWPNQEEAWSYVAIGLKKAVLAVLEETRRRVDQALASATRRQMGADEAQRAMKRWRIISRDTQRKIFEISADVKAAKTATSEKMFEKWDRAIRI